MRFTLHVKLKNTEPTGIRTIRICIPHCCGQEVVSEESFCGPHSKVKGGYGKRILPLYQPLPGLKLPPCLPNYVVECSTKITTLSNGLKITSQKVTHLLERLAFKSTNNRSHSHVVREIEAVGRNVAASASREQMGYTYDTIKTHLPEAAELLTDCVRNPIFLDSEVNEHSVHSAGYSGTLGNPLMASEAVIEKLNGSIINRFCHYRMVLAASGVDHEYVLSIGPPIKVPVSKYVGGDLRFRADSEAWGVLVLFNGVVTCADICVLNEYWQIQSFSAFSSVYDDTGLFGIHVSTGSDFVAEAVDIAAAEELITICHPRKSFSILTTVTEVELNREKNSTKSAVLMNLESRMVVTEDIGRQILTCGLDGITMDDLFATAHKIVSFPVTIGSWVPSYDLVRQHFQPVTQTIS
ncbi:hypothetical protein AMTRI_Chr09g17730 [Amborella trichopoda]